MKMMTSESLQYLTAGTVHDLRPPASGNAGSNGLTTGARPAGCSVLSAGRSNHSAPAAYASAASDTNCHLSAQLGARELLTGDELDRILVQPPQRLPLSGGSTPRLGFEALCAELSNCKAAMAAAKERIVWAKLAGHPSWPVRLAARQGNSHVWQPVASELLVLTLQNRPERSTADALD